MRNFYEITLKKAQTIIDENRLHEDRIKKCLTLTGIEGAERKVSSMGTGGTGLIRYFPNLDVTRIQIGCNYGGFAPCIYMSGNIIEKIGVQRLRDIK